MVSLSCSQRARSDRVMKTKPPGRAKAFAAEEATAIDRWCAGRLPMLAVHARSVGHGINLQSGGRRVVWLSLPDSGEIYAQLNARLWRSGQQSTVFVHRILAANTIDMAIRGLVNKKCLTEKKLLEAMQGVHRGSVA